MAHLQISQVIPVPRMEVFAYLADPKNLPFLLSPTVDVQVLTPETQMRRGNEFHFKMTRFGLTQSVRFHVEDVLPGTRLVYRQSEGLFRSWVHAMKFEEHGKDSTRVVDLVDYELPFGILGFLSDDLLLKRDLTRLLENRLTKAKEHFQEI
jgi:ligand-binding SRPBCC domain-containing protein